LIGVVRTAGLVTASHLAGAGRRCDRDLEPGARRIGGNVVGVGDRVQPLEGLEPERLVRNEFPAGTDLVDAVRQRLPRLQLALQPVRSRALSGKFGPDFATAACSARMRAAPSSKSPALRRLRSLMAGSR
jgi:hypothetical protein